MKTFVVLYNATQSPAEMMANMTAEESKAGMDAWNSWSAEAGDAVVDLGTPMQATKRVTADSATSSSNQASGYSILQAADADAVTAIVEKHPHLTMPGSSIDVFEVLPMPDM